MKAKAGLTQSTLRSIVPLLPVSLEGRAQKIIELVSCGAACTIRDLSLQLRLSSSHLQRLFKQQSGMRLGQWLTEQRLLRAAHLLQHSYLSVKEITHTVGYEHVSSFTRAFERRFDHAPTSFRKQGWEQSSPGVTDSPGRAARAGE